MKILVASGSSVTVMNNKRSIYNISGFSHMISEISDIHSLNGHSVYVASQSVFGKKQFVNGWVLLRKKWYDLILNFKFSYFFEAIRILVSSKSSFSFKLKTILYYLSASYYESIIIREQIDLIHINGIGEGSLPFLKIASRLGIPFVFTLHGLHSFSGTTKATEFAKSLERTMITTFNVHNFVMSIVSTGAKNRLSLWSGSALSNIVVIPNPFDVDVSRQNKNNRDNIILCVGNISTRKNQDFVIQSFLYAVKNLNLSAKLIIIGGGEMLTQLMNKYPDSNNKDIYFTNSIPRESVYEYYKQSSLLVSASIDEGFGLPFIEAFSFGLPIVMFDDIDAVADLYNPDCVLLVKNRTVKDFAKAILYASEKKWNFHKIIEHSKKFSKKNIGENYNLLINSASNNIISLKTYNEMLKEALNNS